MTHRMQINEAYAPYLDCTARTQIFFGGAASGKSTFLAQRCLLDLLKGERNYLVVRAVARTLGRSVWNQLEKAAKQAGMEECFAFCKTEMVVECRLNGAQALFSGMDDPEKLKSITPKSGALTDVWAEEATELPYEGFKQLTKRLRGDEAGLNGERKTPPKRVTLSFNPVDKSHWLWREFFAGFDEEAGKLQEDDLQILRTTYRDNLFLTEDDRRALEEEKDRWYYAVYTKGCWAAPEGTVFQNWRVKHCEQNRMGEARWGLDFGFSADPNALLGCRVDQKRRRIYIFEEFVRGGLHDDELAREVKERTGDTLVVCDCAEPKAISDLCRRGVRAVPAVKGPDSVRFGIRFLQGHEILVSPKCPKTAGELAAYQWRKDKNGRPLAQPKDENNHLMDALRYAVEDLMLAGRAEAAVRM